MNHQQNYVNWTYMDNNQKAKICAICQHYPKREECGARKLVEYDDESETAIVYHIGWHKCHEKLDLQSRRRNLQARTKKYAETSASATQAGKLAVSNLIIQGKAKETKEETKYWIDKRMAQRVINEQQPIHSKDENSFDAVGIMKRTLDEVNEYYIYRINNGSLNGESDYVFKSSKQMAQLAIRMDVNGPEDGLQMENTYFDAAHTRVHSFKSFTLWLVHGPMQKMIRLANMEMWTENSNDIAIFFQLFNEILETVSGMPNYKFNPRCFLCNKGGANYKVVKIVYGEDFCCDSVRGCQFHFKQQVQKKKHEVPEDHWDEFIKICNVCYYNCC